MLSVIVRDWPRCCQRGIVLTQKHMFRPTAARSRASPPRLHTAHPSFPAVSAFEDMGERAVPTVFNLTIDGNTATTATVDTSTAGLVKYTATADGQNVMVSDIENSLINGNDVVIQTGASDQVNVTWARTASSDDLDYFGPLHSLTVNTNGGSYTATDLQIYLDDSLDLRVSTVSGAISINNTTYYSGIFDAHSIELNAGTTGNVTIDTYYYSLHTDSGNVTITASVTRGADGAYVPDRDFIINAKDGRN